MQLIDEARSTYCKICGDVEYACHLDLSSHLRTTESKVFCDALFGGGGGDGWGGGGGGSGGGGVGCGGGGGEGNEGSHSRSWPPRVASPHCRRQRKNLRRGKHETKEPEE